MSSHDFSYDLAAVLPLCISYGVAMEVYQHSTYLLTSSKHLSVELLSVCFVGVSTFNFIGF